MVQAMLSTDRADDRAQATGIPPATGKPAAEGACEVLSNARSNAEYLHLVLAAAPPLTAVRAGQFFQLRCPGGGPNAPFFRRPMSVYACDADRGRVEFLYKVHGVGTRGLAGLTPGDRLDLFGPLGVGFTLADGWRSIVVVGRGVGLATLAPLAELARGRGIGVSAVLSARAPELLMSVERFEEIGARVFTVTDSQRTSGPARVERLIRGLIAEGKADALFTCGSNRLLEMLQRLGRERGIPGQVALEQQMACGLGMCFCCVREFRIDGALAHRRVCWDGPVFDLQEALSW